MIALICSHWQVFQPTNQPPSVRVLLRLHRQWAGRLGKNNGSGPMGSKLRGTYIRLGEHALLIPEE